MKKRLGNEMNIRLEVFNLETGFFGDMECDTRWSDMFCEAKEQYRDYRLLDECPMWGIWVNEELPKI